MTMIDLLRAVYWYDEALQATLRKDGWLNVTRTQSLLFANIAMGETRPVRLAANVGMTRQSMSEMISQLVKRGILVTQPDPEDKRALCVGFHPDSLALRHAAGAAMRSIHEALARRIGQKRLAAMDEALAMDWGENPANDESDSKIN
jgi:DNA-binding MarR family transcriptional regulator